jgi:hypothetical protein
MAKYRKLTEKEETSDRRFPLGSFPDFRVTPKPFSKNGRNGVEANKGISIKSSLLVKEQIVMTLLLPKPVMK